MGVKEAFDAAMPRLAFIPPSQVPTTSDGVHSRKEKETETKKNEKNTNKEKEEEKMRAQRGVPPETAQQFFFT